MPAFDELLQDLRYGLRTLRRSPIFAAVVVLSLALGTGANSALYSVIEATILRELPVDSPERLVYFRWQSHEWFPERDRFAGTGSISRFRRSPTFSNAAWNALRREDRTLSDLLAFSLITDVNATANRQPVRARMQLVSGTFFPGLRVGPATGRIIGVDDDLPGAEPVAVISHRFWKLRFDGNPAAVGSTVAVDGVLVTVAGVAAPGFRSAIAGDVPAPDLWLPLSLGPRFRARTTDDGFWWLTVMGRMRDGVTADQVRGSLEGVFRAAVSATDAPPRNDLPELHVFSARRGAVQERPNDELEHALVLGALFAVLLLIVCVNVANLTLSRAATRRAEIGVRLALGASRSRVVRQLLTESLALAFMGGALGLVLAHWARTLFGVSGFVSADLDLRFDARIFTVTAVISAGTGALFGLVPALRATRLHEGRAFERVEVRPGSPSRLNRWLLVAQVATAVVLLVLAGLFVRTLGKWNSIDAGFNTRNLLVVQVNPEPLGYTAEASAALTERLVARIATLPGVARVTSSGPFWTNRWFGAFFIEGERQLRGHGVPRWLPVRHNFFETLGMPVLAGRAFRSDEDTAAPTVAVVDEHLARRYFGEVSPIGRRITFRQGDPELEIVGMVGNLWIPGTRPEEVMPTIYLPARTRQADFDPQSERRRAAYGEGHPTSLAIRTAGDASVVLPAIRMAIEGIDPALPLIDPKTVEDGIRQRLEPTRVASLIWISFGSVVLALTAIGLYGILSYGVARRTREIGIRTALGARRGDIMRLVIGQVGTLVAIGLVIGVMASMAVNQLVRAYIFGVTFYDLPTVAAVLAVMLVVTGVAGFLPARRASRIDPTLALRWE